MSAQEEDLGAMEAKPRYWQPSRTVPVEKPLPPSTPSNPHPNWHPVTVTPNGPIEPVPVHGHEYQLAPIGHDIYALPKTKLGEYQFLLRQPEEYMTQEMYAQLGRLYRWKMSRPSPLRSVKLALKMIGYAGWTTAWKALMIVPAGVVSMLFEGGGQIPSQPLLPCISPSASLPLLTEQSPSLSSSTGSSPGERVVYLPEDRGVALRRLTE